MWHHPKRSIRALWERVKARLNEREVRLHLDPLPVGEEAMQESP
jgi:hypothetical protein